MPYRVENIVRKGEIACHKQFLLFSQCFPQLYIFTASKFYKSHCWSIDANNNITYLGYIKDQNKAVENIQLEWTVEIKIKLPKDLIDILLFYSF